MKHRIHQILHGYERGHRRLAGSVDLPTDPSHALAVLTDVPDAGKHPAFPDLITGYPLPGTDYYALSKTWPARELPRPGCVWTHTLLLPSNLLSEQIDSPALLAMFLRPEGMDEDERRVYSRTLAPQVGPPVVDQLAAASELLPTILWALYSEPVRAVVATMTDMESSGRQQLLLDLWLQQWPALRASFSFAEAPFEMRPSPEAPHSDLQAISDERLPAWTADEDLRLVTKALASQPPAWVNALVRDINNPGALRKTLWDFAAAGGGARADMASLAAVAEVVTAGAPTVFEVADVLSREFPRGAEMASLKKSLLGPTRIPPADTWPEQAALEAILRAFDPNAFRASDLSIRRRARALCKDDPAAMGQLIAVAAAVNEGNGGSGVRKALLGGVADAVTSDLDSAEKASAAQLGTLVDAVPEVATASSLWRGTSAAGRHALWRSLKGLTIEDELKQKIALAALDGQADEVGPKLVKSWRPAAWVLLEEVAGSSSRKDPACTWLDALRPEDLSAWLDDREPDPELAFELAERLPFKTTRKTRAASWMQVVGNHPLPPGLSEDGRALLLAALLDYPEPPADRLALTILDSLDAVSSFGKRARKALADSTQDGRADLYEQIGQRIARAFVEQEWDPQQLKTMTSSAAFGAIVKALSSFPGGMFVLDTLVGTPGSGGTLRPWQRAILEEAVASDTDRESLLDFVLSFWRK